MTETLLKTPDGNEFVVIEKKRYEALREAEEDLADVLTHRAFRARLAAGEEELLPAEMVDRILGGESPLRVWRERRGLTAAALAGAAGISQTQLSKIERGATPGSIATFKALAAALDLTVDDLI
ncbi:MAG: helix-turn-helix transcriptional regulator [Geminicoccaceae bacterium]|nr:helix-turn-helix transcriptional regulator [Geminicoccaceae bacterium]